MKEDCAEKITYKIIVTYTCIKLGFKHEVGA